MRGGMIIGQQCKECCGTPFPSILGELGNLRDLNHSEDGHPHLYILSERCRCWTRYCEGGGRHGGPRRVDSLGVPGTAVKECRS
ncbi:hypothetical protein EVAR_98749_1 [Eumeta japonica]|uniref:Uncharacterized protein n=1 Tax=Eumeta variegata TaxID=151549 RepID=A0A4C1YYC3_EUMVA|nr:hypothetical protein EVAR_98749_1 [Eumeta japonica]